MKLTYKHLLFLSLITLGCFVTRAAEEDLFDDPMVRDEISLKHRPVYFDNEDRIDLDGFVDDRSYLPDGGWLEYRFLSNRRALTGETCNINKLPSSVNVGSWPDSLNNLLNDDLEDFCEFNGVVNVGVTVNPVFSIRDRSCYYAKGTEAGFCLVASGVDVLSLDVVKAMAIGFYRDGELIKVVPAKEGQDGSGVTLSLIQVPGSDDAVVCVTAEAPGVFDEIALDYSGGVNLSVGQNIRVKYGFVGKSRMFTITKNKKNGAISENGEETPFQKYHSDRSYHKDDNGCHAAFDYAKVWQPVLGIPAAITGKELEKFTDADLDNYTTIVPTIAIGYQGGAKFMMKDSEDASREVFEAGTEVGFCYDFGGVLSLDAGSFINIVLFDHNGNKVSEETVSAGVLALSVAKGGGGSTSIISKVPFSGAEVRFLTVVSVDLSGIMIKYAFVRDKADIRHHCPINPSMDTSICTGSPTYQLRSNPAVSVTWSLVEQPKGANCTVTPDGYVTGMSEIVIENADGTQTVEHDYRFKAEAADGCFDYVTLSFGGFNEVECAKPLVNEKDAEGKEIVEYTLDCHTEGVTGGLLIIDNLDKESAPNVLRNDNTYAIYNGGMQLAHNEPIIGISTVADPETGKKPLIYNGEDYKNGKGMRMGFIVSSAIEGLNLSLLNFFTIKCYYQGKEIYSGVIDENNVVSADVGGANKSQKIRFSILVPEQFDTQKYDPVDLGYNLHEEPWMRVDQIILWTSGVVELKGGELDIYNAFIEDPELSEQCSDVMGCGAELLSTQDTHTTLNFDHFVLGEGLSVASAINDLDNIVDNDKESYATIFRTVGATGVTVAINLGRTLDYRHQLGIVTDNNTYLAGVNVAKVIQVKTLYKGEETGDEFNDWNIVDANVIGYGDKKIIMVTPTMMYDEVLLTFCGTVDVLSDIRVFGLFLRGDADGDGIPDCQDREPCADVIEEITVSEICVGDEVTVSVKGAPGEYTVQFSETVAVKEDSADEGNEARKSVTEKKIKIDDRSKPVMTSYTSAKSGVYQVIVYDHDNKPVGIATYKVHPEETTWLTSATTPDWTKWDNWSNGSPYCCTNVIIPSRAGIYPDLTGEVKEGDEYCCNYIHFEPGGEVNSVMKLNYNRAWVEMALKANRYNLLSVPLQNMFTGDMFVPQAMKGVHSGDYFVSLDGNTSPQNRFDPTIYQRLWYSTAVGRLWEGEKEVSVEMREDELGDALTTKWSREFNHLATPYNPAMGFSLWVDNGSLPEETQFRFRFPKEQTEYNYFSDFDRAKLDMKEEGLKRDSIGRFIFETNKGITPVAVEKLKTDDKRYEKYKYNDRWIYNDIQVNEDSDKALYFPLKAEEATGYFLFGNPFMSRIDIARFLKGNEDRISAVVIYDGNTTEKITINQNGGFDQPYPSVVSIAPMHSVFIMAKEDASNSIDVKVTADMIGAVDDGTKNGDVNGNSQEETLRIKVSNDNFTAGMTVTARPIISGEALLDNEVIPSVAVFVTDNGKAYDRAPFSDRMPLTIIKRAGEKAVMEFDTFGGLERDSYRVADIVECVDYTLDQPIEIPAEIGVTSGRYVLVNMNADSAVDESLHYSDIIVSASNGLLHVRSLDEKIESVRVYALNGEVVADKGIRGANEISFSVPSGVLIVSVTTVDGSHRDFKVLVK